MKHLSFRQPFDFLRFRSRQDPLTYSVPGPAFAPLPGSPARALLAEHPLVAAATYRNVRVASSVLRWPALVRNVCLAPPQTLNQYLAMPRLDYAPGGSWHYSARLALSRLDRPDLVWTPYAGVGLPLRYDTASVAFSATTSVRT